MRRLNPDKLSVEYRGSVTPAGPIIPRCYTLTHSDLTGELFLTIAPYFAYDQINPTRDEVLGKWQLRDNRYIFAGSVYINGEFGPGRARIRNRIFIRELPLALQAIRYGDCVLFNTDPTLNLSPIYIYFDSSYPEFKRTEYWGIFLKYE